MKPMKKCEGMIESPENPRVKHVLGLQRHAQREEERLMVVEGAVEIQRALDSGLRPISIFYRGQFDDESPQRRTMELCRERGAEIFTCSSRVFRKLAYREATAGMVAVVPQFRHSLDEIRLSRNPLLLVAQSIEKPGNLGAILRSADAAGADAVIVCDHCTDIFNPNVVRASVGTLFSLPVIDEDSRKTLAWLRRNGIRIIAAAPHAETDYTDADMRRGTAIVMGEEHGGLSQPWFDAANLKVRIAMRGKADSLNVAAAAAILLFEAVRQRKGERDPI